MITTLWLHLKIGQKKNNTRVFHKVRKTRQPNLEFGPKPGEILKISSKKSTLAFKGG
jgi:hypothetical protein